MNKIEDKTIKSVERLRLNQYHCLTDKTGSKYKVNYHESLAQMTASLQVYNQLLNEKKQERNTFSVRNSELALEIKHVREDEFLAKKIVNNFVREKRKKQKVTQRKKEGNYFGSIERTEIKNYNPNVSGYLISSYFLIGSTKHR